MSEYIEPRRDFDWKRVTWGAPDAPVSETCSYCGQTIPEDHVPLRIWNDEGWTAQFCDPCMTQHWGFAPRNFTEEE